MYPEYGLGNICRLFGKSRQGWYEHHNRNKNRSLSNIIIIKLTKDIREELPRVGVRKLLYMLQPQLKEHNIKIGRDSLYSLLREKDMLLRYRRRKPHTTNSNHRYKKYPNLIRDLILTRTEQLWVSDITYIRLKVGFCYLSIVTDAYSRRIVGYHLHPTLGSEGAVKALLMAVNKRKKKLPLIHHSDRGTQYCCAEYVQLLEYFKIKISMTENGDPYENAIAERVNGILKGEFGLGDSFSTIDHAQEAAREAVRVYNHKRPHLSCNYLTPNAAHQYNGILRKKWKQRSVKQRSYQDDGIGTEKNKKRNDFSKKSKHRFNCKEEIGII